MRRSTSCAATGRADGAQPEEGDAQRRVLGATREASGRWCQGSIDRRCRRIAVDSAAVTSVPAEIPSSLALRP